MKRIYLKVTFIYIYMQATADACNEDDHMSSRKFSRYVSIKTM